MVALAEEAAWSVREGKPWAIHTCFPLHPAIERPTEIVAGCEADPVAAPAAEQQMDRGGAGACDVCCSAEAEGAKTKVFIEDLL